MPFRFLDEDPQSIRASVAFVGRLSDGLIRIGPFSLGLDALFSWIPGLGEAYSALAALFLLIQGARAGVPAPILWLCALMLGGRTLITAIPFAGAAAADLLTAHRWSARLIVASIDRKLAAGRGDSGRWNAAFA